LASVLFWAAATVAVVLLLLLVTTAAVVLLLLLVATGTVLGVVEVAKSVPGIPKGYTELRPVKAWDGLWAFATVPDLPCIVRLGLFSAGLSLLIAIGRVGEVSQRSPDFAWGLLIATWLLAGIESYVRQNEVLFKTEAAAVLVECFFAAVVFFGVLHSMWFKGAAAACVIEIAGFVIFSALAVAHSTPKSSAASP
jgi:hypothetical protein